MIYSVITQNHSTGEICDLQFVDDVTKLPLQDIEKDEILVDCDEDAWLVRKQCSTPLAFDKLNLDAILPLQLYPVIAVDSDATILMFAYTNKDALQKTIEDGLACYFSRSRNKFWKKGEDSGHTQKIVEIKINQKTGLIIYNVEQNQGACHTGYYSCFYRKKLKTGFEVIFKEKILKKKKNHCF